MITTTTRVEGIQDVLKAFRVAPVVAKAHFSEAVQTTKRVLAQRTAQAAPLREGALRIAIVADERKGLTGFIGILSGVIRGQRPEKYWFYPEFGTVHHAAQPYVRPTADREGGSFVARIRNAGKKIERDLSVGRFT